MRERREQAVRRVVLEIQSLTLDYQRAVVHWYVYSNVLAMMP